MIRYAVAALVAGVVIYATTRDGLVLHGWLPHVSLAAPDVVRFQLPDALWEYAFAMTVYAIWRDVRALAIPLALGLAAEILVGTFDPADVVALVAGALAATCHARRIDRPRPAAHLRSGSSA